ncbi:MAG: MBL fold metallo-hydrolase [Halobacteriales archaeon]
MTIENLAGAVSALTSNVFLVRGERPAIVDVGAQFDLVDRLQSLDVAPERVLITHTHPDHVGNLDDVRDRLGIETVGVDSASPLVDHSLDDGDRIALGDHTYEVVHTPGHAPDHLCAFAREPGVLFSGDLVFANGGVGRVDLPGADGDQLRRSIERVVDLVADDLGGLYPGHGPAVEAEAMHHLQAARRMARSL